MRLGWTLIAALAGLVTSTGAQAQPSAFQRCAICHLADGRGVPGAFPPLKDQVAAFATSAQGRAYLVTVVDSGVTGPMTVAGTTYRGFMPAQAGMTDEALAATLTYLVGEVAHATGPAAFTAAEVKTIRAGGKTRSAQESLALRPAAQP